MRKTNLSLIALAILLLLVSVAAEANTLTAWLQNIAIQVPPLIRLLVVISYISGFGFLLGSVMKFKRCAQGMTMMSQEHSIKGPLIYLVVGIALMYFAGFVQVGSRTLFGEGAALAYQAEAMNASLVNTLSAIFTILRLIGYIAFLKGFYILSRLASMQPQPGTLGKGVVHIIGGILAINIEATYFILLNTLVGNPLGVPR